MKVLFYGSFSRKQGNLTERNINLARELARQLVLGGHTVITREGLAKPGKDMQVIDNPALDGATGACKLMNPDFSQLISFCDPVRWDSGDANTTDRTIRRVPNGEHFVLYHLLLGSCDVVVTMGGAAGVERLSLIARFIGKPLIPVGASGGTSLNTWNEFVRARPPGYILDPDKLHRIGHFNVGSSRKVVADIIDLLVDACRSDGSSPHNKLNRIFITHGKNRSFVKPIKDMLKSRRLVPVVSVERTTISLPIPDKIFKEMQSCSAAIIHVDAERVLHKANRLRQRTAAGHADSFTINQNVLIEIGAAMAFYGRRVILLVKEGLALPSNLQGLFEVRFSTISFNDEIKNRLSKAIMDLEQYPFSDRPIKYHDLN